MPRLEPALLPVVADLERGLRTLGVPFAIVGALVPELLLDVRPARMTNDAPGQSLLEELDLRQSEVLNELERLNGRIEQVIAETLAWRGTETSHLKLAAA